MGEAKRRLAAALASDKWPGGRARCPQCLGERVTCAAVPEGQTFYGKELAVCGDCRIGWEPIEEAEIWDRSDRYCCGSAPCDNCAFRPGSNEQLDREKWRGLIGSLKAGASFYCHKGVPIAPRSDTGFAYPADRRKLRLCRGYLNALSMWWAKDKETAG